MLALGLALSNIQGARGGGGEPAPVEVGGVAIGAAGTGLYSGFLLADGHDFAASQRFTYAAPATASGDYFSTRHYGKGARNSDGLLNRQYDTDPANTGHLDSGRGEAIFDNLSLQPGGLSLQARQATTEEAPLILATATAAQVSAMVHTGGRFIQYLGSAGAIIEAKMTFSAKANNPKGPHPTFWLATWDYEQTNGSYDSNELNFEGSGQKQQFNWVRWNNGVFTDDTIGANTLDFYDGLEHTFTFVLEAAACKLYVDGTLRATVAEFLNTKGLATYIIFSNHVYDGTFLGETYTAADWSGGKQMGMSVAWWRSWAPAAAVGYEPAAAIPDLNVDYNGTGSLVLPSAASLWGATPTVERLRWIRHEESALGYDRSAYATQLPAGVTYNAGTRTVTADFSADFAKPGRAYMTLGAYDTGTDGSYCKPARFVINRGPVISTVALNANTNESYSYDLYTRCNVGDLLPKVVTVSGLPATLTFDPDTGLITGTPTVSTTYSVTLGVTNCLGQTASKTVTLTVAVPVTAPAYESWTGPGWFDASDVEHVTLSGSNVSALVNKRTGGGDLTAAGTTGKMVVGAVTQNAHQAIRVTADVSSSTALPRLSASPTVALSAMCQGSDKPYTVIMAFTPRSAVTGYPWGWSDTVDNVNSQVIGVVSRNATACGVRRMLLTSTTNEVTWGSGQASGTTRILAVSFTGTAVTVWDVAAGGTLTKTVNGVAQDVNAFNTELTFRLFAVETNSNTDPTYATTQRSIDFYEILVEDTAKADADVEQAIRDLGTKWGIPVT